jgi:hypothetical protein
VGAGSLDFEIRGSADSIKVKDAIRDVTQSTIADRISNFPIQGINKKRLPFSLGFLVSLSITFR